MHSLFFFILLFILDLLQNYNPKSDNESSRFYSIIINKGDTLSVVSNKLYDSGLIKNKEFFKFFAKLYNFEKSIKSGTHITYQTLYLLKKY